MCYEHDHDHPNNLQIECNAFCVSGHVIGFLLWEEGSGNKALRVVVQWNFLFQVFCKVAASFSGGVTLKGLRGVENTVAVE